MVGIHASGISIPLSLLMLLGWRRIWIAPFVRQTDKCILYDNPTLHFSFGVHHSDLANETERSY